MFCATRFVLLESITATVFRITEFFLL